MVCRKEEETEKGEQAKEYSLLACRICGRRVKAEKCSWREDDDGLICCQDCRAERESCGCSD